MPRRFVGDIDGRQSHFRCRTGHAYAPVSLLAGQAASVEESLNEAYRALLEKAHMEKRMMKRAQGIGAADRAAYHDGQAKKPKTTQSST